VPEKQWGLPVGLGADGEKPVTLRELADGTPALLPSNSLTDEQRTGLITSRIRAQQTFKLSIYGVGVIERERAISEVERGSRIGKSIAQVELLMIQDMVERVKGKDAPATP
jgi:hypothetical protein